MEKQTYYKVTCNIPFYVDVSDINSCPVHVSPPKSIPVKKPVPPKKKSLSEIYSEYNKLVDNYIEKYN